MKFIEIPEIYLQYINSNDHIIEICEGGIMVFDSNDDRETWLNQK